MTTIELTKLTVNLTPDAMDALTSAAEYTGMTRTEVIDRALHLYEMVYRPMWLPGRTIADVDDPTLKVHVTRKRRWPWSR